MKRIVTVYLVLTAFVALAWPASSFAGDWFFDQKIQYLYAGEAGARFAVRLVGVTPNPASCPVSYDLVIDPNNTKFKAMWTMLLAGYLADKHVSVFLNGCDVVLRQPVIADVMLGTTAGNR